MNVNELQIIGFGHSGVNILNKIKSIYPKAFCIVLTADKENLKISNADKSILLSGDGLGCGLDYELGMRYVQNKQQEILDAIDLDETIVLISALGGGCSSGSFLECSRLLEEKQKFCTLISFPMDFESKHRIRSSLFVMSQLLEFVGETMIYPIEHPKNIKGKTLRTVFELMDKKFIEQLERL